MANATGLQFTLLLPGADDITVVDFSHHERLSTPYKLTATFTSRNPGLDPADHLDRNATLTIWQESQALRRIHGIVTEFGRGDSGHRRTFYTLTLQPALWRLSLRHNSRIFQHASPLAIIRTLCDERGITDVAFAVTREPAEREYCVQYRETDLAFIQRLAAEEGLFYFHEFFETGNDASRCAHRLVFADTPQALAHLGKRSYHCRTGGTPPLRHLRKLRQVSRIRPASATLKDYSFKRPAYSQLHQAHLYENSAEGLEAHAQRGIVDKAYEHYDYPGRYKRDASGEAFTRIRLEQLRRDALTADAESDLPEVAPGHRFTLTDHDADRLNRDWQVVSVVHHGRQPQALEEDGMVLGKESQGSDQGGMTQYHNELMLMPTDHPWRAEPNPKPRVDGPQVAFVVGPEGEEIHCDEHGRVKVQFPWDRYAEPDTAGAGGEAAETAGARGEAAVKSGPSAWIRVSQGWAGGGYGSIAIPRIGHEVVVSFLEGDPDQPLITGRTYHAVNTPPYALPAHKTRTVIRTQSHKGDGFNELRFEDKAEREQIWLHAQRDLELLTHNDRSEEIGNDSCLTVHHNRVSEIHGGDHLTVHGQRRIRIDGDDHLIVNATRHEKYGSSQISVKQAGLEARAG